MSGITIDFNDVQFLNASDDIPLKFSGKLISESEEQFRNAQKPIFSTFAGISIVSSDVQFSNNLSLITFMFSGSETSLRAEQFENAAVPIFVIVDGIFISDNSDEISAKLLLNSVYPSTILFISLKTYQPLTSGTFGLPHPHTVLLHVQ